MTLQIGPAQKDGRELNLLANLGVFDSRLFYARGRYDTGRGCFVMKRQLVGQDGFEWLSVNALGWLPG